MNLNFFREDCQYAPITAATFGLCDDQDGGKAYPHLHDPVKWIATVVNQRQLAVTFTAIDKCVLHDDDLRGTGRCDGMLTTQEHLYLVELKDMDHHWISDTIKQLLDTVDLLRDNHNIQGYKYRKVFAANRRRPHFAEVDHALNLRVFRETGFRIDVQARVLVV